MRDSLKKYQILLRKMTNSKRMNPSLMVIGCGKCGTTSMYNYLIKHPQIIAPFKKEIDFFDKNFERGYDWYNAHFPYERKNCITVDVSPSIIYNDKAVHEITKKYPDMKFCVMIREPVSRAYSGYRMAKRYSNDPRTFDDAVAEEISGVNGYPSYIVSSIYYQPILHLLDHIKKENLIVVEMEELRKNTDKIMNDIYKFVGISEFHHNNYEKHNVHKPTNKMNTETEKFLKHYFKPYNHKLEMLINKQLNW